MGLEIPTPTAAPIWESTFDEFIERTTWKLVGLKIPTPTATPVWGLGSHGLENSNAYCYTSLEEHF